MMVGCDIHPMFDWNPICFYYYCFISKFKFKSVILFLIPINFSLIPIDLFYRVFRKCYDYFTSIFLFTFIYKCTV